jgi:hypothetical protein
MARLAARVIQANQPHGTHIKLIGKRSDELLVDGEGLPPGFQLVSMP